MPSSLSGRKQFRHDGISPWVSGSTCIWAATFGVVATGTGEGEIARIVGTTHLQDQRRGLTAAKPGSRHNVLECGAWPWLAISAHSYLAAAVQARGLPPALQR